jgi:hypothetical protein
MWAPATYEHPQTREALVDWLSDRAPHLLNLGKTFDELEVMSDKELTQLYDAVLGINYYR